MEEKLHTTGKPRFKIEHFTTGANNYTLLTFIDVNSYVKIPFTLRKYQLFVYSCDKIDTNRTNSLLYYIMKARHASI